MDTRQALLKAVLAAPDDDLPRLVYADWLEENGQQVAADYIRIACAGDAVTTLEYSRRHWREVDDFRDVVKYGMGYDYSRGFVSGVHCSLANWLKHGPAVVREHPVVKVVLTDREPAQGRTDQWCWYFAGFGPQMPHHLTLDFGSRDRYELFDTAEKANEWLSRRAIEWAKSQPV